MLAPNDTPEDDGLPDFGSLGERFGFIAKHDGLKALRRYMTDRIAGYRREYIEEAADELLALGIVKPARVVAEIAALCTSLADLRDCDYLSPPYVGTPGNEANVKAWIRSRERAIGRIRKRRRELLRKAGIEPGCDAFTCLVGNSLDISIR